METTTLTRAQMCALCYTTEAKRGSLCHTCADEIDRYQIDDAPIPNFEQCNVCGGELSRNGHCWTDECSSWKWGAR